MGKKITYINKKGEEIAKSAFNKSEDCQITIDPKNGKWELLAVCNPTKEMLEAAGDNLAQWLTVREKMAIPYEKGSKITIGDDRPDEFYVTVPSSSIRRKDTVAIGTAWSEWAKKLTEPAPDPAPAPAPAPAKAADPAPAPAQNPAPAKKKMFWDMTDEERIAYNDERINFYLNRGKK